MSITRPVLDQPSPHFDPRKENARPSYIILHYTGTKTADEARLVYEGCRTDEARVSPHYMVDVDGAVTRHVPEDKRAWHAGTSFWAGEKDMNSYSIGIEIVNAGHEGGLPPYPAAQIESVIALCQDITVRHAISKLRVLGHSDIAITRKIDPGEHFPWEALAARGVGFWPRPTAADRLTAKDAVGLEPLTIGMLGAIGYDTSIPLHEILVAFQRHYHPEIFALDQAGQADPETLARLICLFRALPDTTEASVGRMIAGGLTPEESPGISRTQCRVIPGGGDPRDSATENKPPAACYAGAGKGETAG